MTAVILEFKRPIIKNIVPCCICGEEATHHLELVEVAMNRSRTVNKFFCDQHFPNTQAGE